MSKWEIVYDLHDIPDNKWLPIKIVSFVDYDKCCVAWKWRRMTKKEWDKYEKEQSKGENK